MKKYGYHVTPIPKGKIGHSSKLLEEVLELIDAEKQGCTVMAVVELSDLVGAIESYLKERRLGVTIDDLKVMSGITRRAFENGFRK